MKIKDRVYKKVVKEVDELVSDEVYGCDQCQREIDIQANHLSVTTHNDGLNSETLQHEFCCWECLAKFMPTIKSNYFVSLPFVHYDKEASEGCRIEDFLKVFKPSQL